MPRPLHFETRAENTERPIALAKVPAPMVGWLAHARNTEGNLFGMMPMDSTAK